MLQLHAQCSISMTCFLVEKICVKLLAAPSHHTQTQTHTHTTNTHTQIHMIF